MEVNIIKNPAGTYKFVGQVPTELGYEICATKAAIIGQYAYRNADGKLVELMVDCFRTREEAIEHLTKHGHEERQHGPVKLKAERYAEGKWDVCTLPPYPHRVGHIIGGNRRYLSEFGAQDLGYFNTKKAALAAISYAVHISENR